MSQLRILLQMARRASMAGTVYEPPPQGAASSGRGFVHADPRTACFYARRALELAVAWAYKHDAALKLPYQDNLSRADPRAELQGGGGRGGVQQGACDQHARQPRGAQPPRDPGGRRAGGRARAVPRELLARAHLRPRGAAGAEARLRSAALPKPAPVPKQTPSRCSSSKRACASATRSSPPLLADKTALDEELKRLRAEVAAAKQAAAAQPDTHDYSEAETRDYFIDLLLTRPAGRSTRRATASSRSPACPTTAGQGLRRLRAVGRRRQAAGAGRGQAHRRDARVGPAAGQALRRLPGAAVRPAAGDLLLERLRALALGRHPLPAAPGAGLLQEGRAGAADPAAQHAASRWPRPRSTPAIVERYYQTRAIRRIAEAFEHDNDRKALVVMATGAGKTRTVIALCDLLMRCNWAKRVLFLADRVALVNQAVNAFKRHLPDCVAGQPGHREGRRGPGLRLDLPDDDGPDRRDAGRPAPLRPGPLRPRHHRRGAPLGVPEVPRDLRLLRLAAGRAHGHAQGRGRPQHLRPVRPGERRADRRLRARRGGARRLPRAAAGGLRAAQVPARGHPLRRALRGGEGPVGRAGVGRGRRRARPGRGRGGQQVAVQQRHRRQGAGAPDDARPEGGGRRPARQDDHLRQEPGTTPSSSPSASTPTTRTTRASSPASSPTRPSTRRA